MHKNKTFINGKVLSSEESHSTHNETFFRVIVESHRLSGEVDKIPFIVPQSEMQYVKVGSYITSSGEIRTVNKMVDGKNKLIVFNYSDNLYPISEESYFNIEDKNVVHLQGFLVKAPKYRETHKKRKISEMIVAHNRSYNKESYVPTIAWGNDANYVKDLSVGTELDINGRFQSRKFFKKDGTEHTTYELSILSVNVLETEEA